MAKNGLRVLAFAKKVFSNASDRIGHDDVKDGLVLLGLQAMIDPPRQEVIRAVKRCQDAGIRVKMITGDHVLTAVAIARQIGLQDGYDANDKIFAVTGKELEHLTDKEWIEVAQRSAVFARVVPE